MVRPTRQVPFLADKSPDDGRIVLSMFSRNYIADWDMWSAARGHRRVRVFGQTHRRWKATRGRIKGRTMRRPEDEACHVPGLCGLGGLTRAAGGASGRCCHSRKINT